jgi:hypothetical protein
MEFLKRRPLVISLCFALTIEAVVILYVSLLVHRLGGHSALASAGILLHFPSSILGIIIGESIQTTTEQSAVASITSIVLTVFMQSALYTAIIFFVLRRILRRRAS